MGLTALHGLVLRFGSTVIAGRFATVLLRTLGRLMNVSGFLPGLPIRATPGLRALTGPFTIFPITLFTPGLNSFLAGFAYRDNEELTRGWLSFFGELLLQDVPLVEGNLETAIKRLRAGDFRGFGGAAANALQEDIGLSTLAAFFRGISQIQADQSVLGFGISPAPFIFGGLVATVNWLSDLINQGGRALGGLLEPILGKRDKPPTKARPPTPGEKATGEEEIRRRLRQIGIDPDLPLPETEADVKKFLKRATQVLGGLRGLLDLIKDKEPNEKAIEKVARVVGRLFG